MRILGLDFETTGLDTKNDRIIEIGAVLWETDTKQAIYGYGAYLYDDTYPALSEDINRITGITDSVLREFGKHPFSMLKQLNDFALGHGVKYVVAHNGENFDKPILHSELQRAGYGFALTDLPWIDSKQDLPFEVEPDSRKLKHLALDQGFINPFPHRAQYDVLTMLKVLSAYDFSTVVEYSKIPWITVRAYVDYDKRELAKEKRYSWENLGDKKYSKCWVKKIKENQLENERKTSAFEVLVLS